MIHWRLPESQGWGLSAVIVAAVFAPNKPLACSFGKRLIGAEVTIEQADGLVRICHAGGEVARHPVLRGRERAIDPAHLAGRRNPATGPATGVG